MGTSVFFVSLVTRGLFSLELESPVVVDTIVVKREGNKLHADVEHLQVEVEVGRLKVLVSFVCVLGTETGNFLEVIEEVVPGIVVIKHKSKTLHNNNHDESSELNNSKGHGNIREVHPSISHGQESPNPKQTSKRPGGHMNSHT